MRGNHLKTRSEKRWEIIHFLIGLAVLIAVGAFLAEMSNRKYERWISECQEVLELDLARCEALWSLK